MTAFFHKYIMDLKELHDFKLSDALYFHTDLNQAIFDGDHMNDEVRQQLLIIADDFIEHLGIDDLDVKDITLSGSNAAYSYTKHSDIDLHILVDMTRFTDDDVYRELFDAKKIVYNDQHDIIINGYEVELYVQDANEPVISLGEYSILNNKWIKLPRKRKANLDQVAAKVKFKKIAKLAEFALRSNSYEKIQGVLKTIKKYRQAGLDLNGEFGPENLAFKALRTQGIIKRLYEKLDELHSERLSLPESKVIRKVKRNDLADSLANEFTRFKTEDCDPTYNVNEAKLVEFEGVTLKISKHGHVLVVNALDDWGNKTLGHVKFNIGDGKELDPQDLEVDDKYQGQGIAKVMYDYVKSLGYTIVRSYDQTDAGAGFWNKHRGEDVRVWEAFDNPYKGKWEKSDYGDVDLNTKLPDGTNLSIMFNNQQGDEGEEVVQVEFYRNNSQEVTGEGDAQRIFATVLDAIQKYIKKYKPQRLSFSASKATDPTIYYEPDQPQPNPESRAKLYDRLVQRYSKALGYRAFRADNGDIVIYELSRIKQGVAEGVPQPGESSGAPKQFGPDAKIQTRKMTVGQIISSIPGVPYYNNVVDDWAAKDYHSWNVTEKAIEYAEYFKKHPESLAQLKPIIVLNGKFEDGAHRVSAIWLLQQRMDPKNPLWANFKLNVQFVKQDVTEDELEELANSSLKVKEPKDLVNTNDRKQVTYKVMKFKSGKNKFLINFTVKGAPAFGKKSNWNAVNVAFGVKEKQDDYSFGDEMNTDLTAKNKNQFIIYSTVINAIRKFITEYNTEIDEIIIQGAGKRQLMMYQRFFRVASKYFPGWHYDGKHSLVRDVPRQQVKKEDVSEASGYIPSEKEKNDPRFKTALTVDVKPDSIKKNASAFNFKVSRAGIPPLLRK